MGSLVKRCALFIGRLNRYKEGIMLHMLVACVREKPGNPTRTAALVLLLALTPAFAKTQQHSVRIRIINAKTNRPVTDEKLNVALRVDQVSSVAMPTDKNGIILVDTGTATTIRILSNMYADCRSRGELYTDYPIATILKTGITTGNLCSDAKPRPRPGELILFEIPKTYVPVMPNPPASSLPHSDQNPN
jgi:hypothetical protein